MKLMAVGDVHGMIDHLEIMLKAVDEVKPDVLLFTGDYLDRGVNSRAVLKRIMDIHKDGNVVLLRGNHCEMAFEAVLKRDKWSFDLWVSNGGNTVLRDYGIHIPLNHDEWASFEYQIQMAELRKDLKWLDQNTLLYKEFDKHLFVHAGIMPEVPLEQQDSDRLLWIRKEFLQWPFPFQKYVVHGHTVTEKLDIDILSNRCNIDGGAVFGGKLIGAVFDFDRDDPYPIQVISVDSDDVQRGTYEVRDGATY